MTAARCAIGNYCYKKSINYILDKCKWLDINKTILNASLKLLHKIIINKKPNSIYNMFKFNRRQNVDIVTLYIPKTVNYESFYVYKGLKNFNKLPKNLKNLPPEKFKSKIKQHLKANVIMDSMD